MEPTSDSALWQRVRGNDSGAFAEVFDRYAQRIYAYCFRRTGEWAVAEELMAAVFAETWRKREDVSVEEAGLAPWLYGVATNMIRNHRRARRRYRRLLEGIPPLQPELDFSGDLDDRVDAERAVRAVARRLSSLPRRERDAVMLTAEGLTATEVGEALRISPAAARGLLFRARRRLAARPSGADLSDQAATSSGVNST